MTRQEFIVDLCDFDQLRDFADTFSYEFDDVYTQEQYDSEIDDRVSEDDLSWQDLRDYLTSLPDGYDFYTRDQWGDWEGRHSDDIDDLKAAFLNWADGEDDVFDPEEEEEDEEDWEGEADEQEETPEDGEPVPESEFTMDDLLSIVWGKSAESA